MKSKILMMVVLSAIYLNPGAMASPFMFPFMINFLPVKNNLFFQFKNMQPKISASENSTSSDWELCYESDKIYIYERWVKNAMGIPIRERRGLFAANSDVANAVKFITKCELQKKWMKNVEESKIVKKKNDSCWIAYALFGLPWPLDNRDVVSEYSVKMTKSGAYAQVNINSVNNVVKESEGISRILNYKASWTIRKTGASNVSISFIASSDAPAIAPAFVLDPVLRKTFHKNLLNLRKMLELQLLVKL